MSTPDSNDASPPSAAPSSATDTFPIIGVGISPAGLSGLAQILRTPALEGAAVVLVGASDAADPVGVVRAIATDAGRNLDVVVDGAPLRPNHLYLVPPDQEAELTGDVIRLHTPEPHRSSLPVDTFLRSLARERSAAARAIVLLGCAPDGGFGIESIRAEGGLTFLARSERGGEPDAFARGVADFALEPEEIAAEMSRLSRTSLALEGLGNLSAEALSPIFSVLKASFGIDLSYYKLSTIRRRIERRMAVCKVARFSDYVALVKSNRPEASALYRDLLIKVTSFFRDDEPFEFLRETIFPKLLEGKRPGSAIRIWTAGCATGEETYSTAIALFEFLGDRIADYKVQVFGTDIDPDAITAARHGVYPPNIALDVSPERLHRFFVARDGKFHIPRRIRDAVVFAQHNLTQDAPFSRLDLVICRNVLIYLQGAAQKRVFRTLNYALNPSGLLMLGNSETVGDSELFSVFDKKNKVYLKRHAASFVGTDLAPHASSIGAPRAELVRLATPVYSGQTVQQLADRKILERYGPPGVIVNEAFEVLQFRGKTGPYLEPTPGHATLNILKLARAELQLVLRALLPRAFAEDVPLTSDPVRLRLASSESFVQLQLIPLRDQDEARRCVAVLFEELPEEPATLPAPAQTVALPVDSEARRVKELEQELIAVKDYLQRTIEELETSNEELKASNEELQSSNEELQSTNEELETSKEELQSSNEELTTVNDELQDRMAELSTVSDDLQNVLTTVEPATLLVGRDLRIRHFSRSAARMLDLVAADAGRNLVQVRSFLDGLDVESLCADSIKNISLLERTVTVERGRFGLKILPYQTADLAIRGAVIILNPLEPPNGADSSAKKTQGP